MLGPGPGCGGPGQAGFVVVDRKLVGDPGF